MLTHFLYWVAIVLVSIIYGLGYNQPIMVSVILKFIILPVQIIATYLFMYWQFPFLVKKKYWTFTAAVFFPTYVLYALLHLNHDFGLGLMLSGWHKPHTLISIFTDLELYFRYIVDIYMVVFISMGIKLVKDQFESNREMQIIQSEKVKSEYQYIQARLQPEFLLRTLKVIQTKSAVGSDDTPLMISNLAEILDYTLYQSDKTNISLQEEIEKLEIFLSTYAQGSDGRFNIHVDVEETPASLIIAPLTLLNLAESILQRIEKNGSAPVPLDLKIHLETANETCSLTVDVDLGKVHHFDGTSIFDVEALTKILDIEYARNYDIHVDDVSNKTVLKIKLFL